MDSELDIAAPWLRMDVPSDVRPGRQSDPERPWILRGERCWAVIAWGWMEQETRQASLMDDTIPHRVLWVPKLSENLHDAITVDYSKESRSECWQGNETGIAVLISGDVKPGGWASRAWKERELAIVTDTVLIHRRELELSSYCSNANWIYLKIILPRITFVPIAYHLECDVYLTLYWWKSVLKANRGTASRWFSFQCTLAVSIQIQYSTDSSLSEGLARMSWWTKLPIYDEVAFF